MSINNTKSITDEKTELLRSLIEHRATWLYLMIDEAAKNGLDKEDFAREAVRRCGCFHGNEKFVDTDNLPEYAEDFLSEEVRDIFEMNVEVDEKELVVEFNYCPLVTAWMKFTDDEKLIDEMCDIAMEGDRGIVSTYDEFDMELQQTIAGGADKCRMVIKKIEDGS